MWRVGLLACAVICTGELFPEHERGGALRIMSDAEPSFMDVIVKRVNDTLALTCGDGRWDVRWLLPPAANARLNTSGGGLGAPAAWVSGARLQLAGLREADSGAYVCAAPPYSVGKHVVVQPPAPGCARGGFSCGPICVLPRYVCDGRPDCPQGEDESEATCGTAQPCYGKLQCGDGRCISDAWCCDAALERDCVRPSCCERYVDEVAGGRATADAERAPPDDYGFIQTSIYTVTACALIFMIAVVLLVSAICKMHMKRAALHSYARTERTRHQYALPCQYPPRYEPPRLLDDIAPDSPQHQMAALACAELVAGDSPEAAAVPARPTNFGLGRLADVVFSSRYRAVPTHCIDVEMMTVPPGLRHPSPDEDDGAAYYFTGAGGGAAVERLLERLVGECGETERDRPPALRLGRFRLSLPRFAGGRRPDTPDVPEPDTYTLNGRTIRLLGAEFAAYPPAPGGRALAPPPAYSEAPKPRGPPPAYLSREDLAAPPPPPAASTDCNGNTTEGADPPPRYEELPVDNCDTLDDNANVAPSD